ncbi:MAG: AAA family ATPase [Candidatus Krumholzibacteriia bacterium]
MERSLVKELADRLRRMPRLLQIVVGPRQVGKTTAALAVVESWPGPARYAAADRLPTPGTEWIETQWTLARRDAADRPALLVLDEVQKVRGWSETVKALWDEDRRQERALRVVLVGSSALLLEQGATDSLAGRYFLDRCPHWSFDECREAFGWSLDRWLYFGGYPGAAPLCGDEDEWRAYIADSLIEAAIARDVLALQTVNKPALLRQLFGLAARLPAQVVSYNKMLGQLQDAGNTTTLTHYLRLLATAFLVSGLERYSGGEARTRGSSPKLILWNNALVTAMGARDFAAVRAEPELWGRLVENAVGAHLLNHLQSLPFEITYGKQRAYEVDFIVRAGRSLWALEVKSGRPRSLAGLARFRAEHPKVRPLLIGSGGIELEEFFATDPRELLG